MGTTKSGNGGANPLPGRLRRVMDALGLDEQQQLASLIGVTPGRFSNYMASVTPGLGWAAVCGLDRLGVNMHYLITGDGPVLMPRERGVAETAAGYALPPVSLERLKNSLESLTVAELQELRGVLEVTLIQKIVSGGGGVNAAG